MVFFEDFSGLKVKTYNTGTKLVLMVEFIRDENLLANATELDQSKLKALNDQTRLEILKILSETPSYPSEIAEKLGISKQKAYYHFEKLKDAGLLEKKIIRRKDPEVLQHTIKHHTLVLYSI